MPASADERPSFIDLLAPVWLVTAAWDFVCASVLARFAYHSSLATFWRGVAAVALGRSAFDRGVAGTLAGVGVHMVVAFVWSAIFVVALRAWPALRRTIASAGGALAVAAIYGPLIWMVMSLVVIPLRAGSPPRIGLRWWVQLFAHIPFVTIPLVFTARSVLRASSEPTPATLAPSVAGFGNGS